MPLSTSNKGLQEVQKLDNKRKRKLSESSPNVQSKKSKTSTTEMTDAQKRANFSALTAPNNGFNRHNSPVNANKPGSAKKLVIKNFKGENIYK